ncbi:MAG: hypothetical protein AB3N07_11140, partial [Ruegeria sp.]
MSEFDTIAKRALGKKPSYADAKQGEHARNVLQGLADQGDASPAERAALRALNLNRSTDQEEIGASEATYRGAAQGATLSARDELAGALGWFTGGMTNDAYTSARDESRRLDEAAQQAFPEEFATGKTAGNISTMAIPGGAALKATKGMGLAGKSLVGGLTMGAAAGADGFMSGEGFTDRIDRAKLPALIGAGFGILAPGAGYLAGRGVRGFQNMRRSIPDFGPVATNRVARSLDSRRLGDAADIEAYLAGLGDEAMLADVPGAPRKLAQGVAAMPGKGGDILQDAIENRASGASERVSRVVDDTLGQADEAFDARRALAAERSSKLGPEYDAALTFEKQIDVSGIQSAVTLQAGESSGSVKSSLRRLLSDLGEGKVSAVRLHNIRSELSDAVNKARVSGAKKFSTQMDPILRMIDDKLDAVPGYRDARLGYGANKALDDAIEDGRKVFSGSAVSAMSPAELREAMANMSPAQKDAFRKGAREWVSALMGTCRNDAAAAWGAFEKGWNDQKLRLVLGHEAAEKVIKRLRAEKTFSGTRGDVLAGSQTQFRDEAAGALVDLRDVDTGRRPGPLSRAKRALDDVGNAAVDSVLYGPRRRNANAEIGGILSLQGKA